MSNLTRGHLVLWLGMISLVAFIATGLLGPSYDSGGLKSASFLIAYVLSSPFRWLGFFLTSLNGGRPVRFQLILILVIGITCFVLLDWGVTALRRR